MRTISTLLSISFITLLSVGACTKDEPALPAISTSSAATADQSATPTSPFSLAGLARYAGEDYSQSISVTLANEMIGSYLSSVSYPSYDTALRSLTFDADTLRGYLQDTSIKTLRFYVAHTPAYAASLATKGKYAGLSPSAVTFIIAGLNHNDQVVPNRRGEVYEHMMGCPMTCAGSSAVLIQ